MTWLDHLEQFPQYHQASSSAKACQVQNVFEKLYGCKEDSEGHPLQCDQVLMTGDEFRVMEMYLPFNHAFVTTGCVVIQLFAYLHTELKLYALSKQ